MKSIAGIDEAGRGPLAGPVVAAAVILPPTFAASRPQLPRLQDSKKLSAAARAAWRDIILAEAKCSIGLADVFEIENLNILQATFLAMRRAQEGLESEGTQEIWVDGNQKPAFPNIPPGQVKCFIGGDALHACISAASIIAKTTRDAIMTALHEEFPQYAWNKNMGYGTATHRTAIIAYGPSPHHRTLFLRKIYGQNQFAA